MYSVSIFEQTEHEQVLAARAKELGKFYRVLADPDVIRSTYTHDAYPNIIVIDRRNNVLFIEQVETESSVTENERNEQWESYSKFIYPFNLIVPRSQEIKARRLIRGLNIHKLYYYELTSIGIRFRQVIK